MVVVVVVGGGWCDDSGAYLSEVDSNVPKRGQCFSTLMGGSLPTPGKLKARWLGRPRARFRCFFLPLQQSSTIRVLRTRGAVLLCSSQRAQEQKRVGAAENINVPRR